MANVSYNKSIIKIWAKIGYKYGENLNVKQASTSEKNGRKSKQLPQVPILIPLIVAGAFLGSVWSGKDLAAVWKKAVFAAIVSGILNAGYVWLLGLLKISTTELISNVTGAIPPTNNKIVFMASCGVGAFLIVVTVYLSALGMMRYRRGKTLEPEE